MMQFGACNSERDELVERMLIMKVSRSQPRILGRLLSDVGAFVIRYSIGRASTCIRNVFVVPQRVFTDTCIGMYPHVDTLLMHL